METPEPPASSPEPPPSGVSVGAALVPGQVLNGGRFKLKAVLGQGGMGQVWLAQDLRLGEDNALKVLPPEIRNDPVALDDLRRETLKSRKLTHPNIIRLYDFHEAPGEPAFIAMEFVEGQNLSALRLQQPDRLFTWSFIEPLVKQLCEALDYAHSEKVIHRDLKPANMMIDGRSRLKLADFGIAATMSDSASRVSLRHTTSGTVTYMSPQQMDGELPRVTDDIYALGATLYEFLTSRPPFNSGDIPHQVRNLPAKPLDERLVELELSNAVPPAVAALVMACLSKDPAQRPQSARAVAEWIGFPAPQPSGASLMDTVSDGGVAAPAATAAETPVEDIAAPTASRAPLWIGMVVAIVALVCASVWLLKKPAKATSKTGAKTTAPAAVAGGAVAGPVYTSLFNGKDFSGWTVPEPNPLWTVEKGVLLGKQPKQPKRGFQLTSQKSYQDFILEVETRYSLETDAAIILRKDQKLQWRIGHYRAQPEDATGNLGEAGNSAPTLRTKEVDKAAKPGGWNKLRLRAEGNSFKVWLNDRQILDYTSTDFPSPGPISLALFGKGDSQVELRNLRITESLDEPPALAPTASAPPVSELAYSVDATYNTGAGPDGLVYCVAAQRDGKAVVAGAFKNFDGTPSSYVARLTPEGKLDKTFDATGALIQEARALAIQPDGKVLVSGSYKRSASAAFGNLARLGFDGHPDADFNPKVAGNIHSLVLMANGDIVVAGSFTTVNDEPFVNVIRLKSDGGITPGFVHTLAMNREVRSVAQMSDGRIVFAGSFSSVNKGPRNHVCVLSPNGALDKSFLPGTLLNAMAWSTVAQPDGKILVAGRFTKAGPMKCSHLVRFTPQGKADPTFNPGAGPNGETFFMMLTPRGKIIIGGAFTAYNDIICGHLAVLNEDGSLDYGFPECGADGTVHSVALGGDGSLIIAGGFSYVGGQPHRGVARLKPAAGKAVR